MGMRERAEMGNGALTIDGTLGKGTTVTVQIPLMGGVE
jgi:signal transduction histidine kinase